MMQLLHTWIAALLPGRARSMQLLVLASTSACTVRSAQATAAGKAAGRCQRCYFYSPTKLMLLLQSSCYCCSCCSSCRCCLVLLLQSSRAFAVVAGLVAATCYESHCCYMSSHCVCLGDCCLVHCCAVLVPARQQSRQQARQQPSTAVMFCSAQHHGATAATGPSKQQQHTRAAAARGELCESSHHVCNAGS